MKTRRLPAFAWSVPIALSIAVVVRVASAASAGEDAAKAPVAAAELPGVIPQPANYHGLKGTCTLTAASSIAWNRPGAKAAGELLALHLILRGNLVCKVVEAAPTEQGKAFVQLQLDDADPVMARMPAEGYVLQIANSGVTLKARTASGLFYGTQTLTQLIDEQTGTSRDSVVLPNLEIADRPRFAWRGLMLDESRHFFGKKRVEELLDVMAYLKLNRFHWHLTDEPGWRIEIKKYPKLAEIGGRGNWSDPAAPPQFYTQDDIREVVAFAAARHIEIVPEIDMPGHASAACLAYPELSGGGAGFTFNPAREETYAFLEDVLKEVAALFPSQYIHIGGDEVSFGSKSWSTDPAIVKFTKDHKLKNAIELEHYFMQRMVAAAKKLGKRPMGWDDMSAAAAPGDIALFWWHHERPKVLTQALAKGYSVVLCPRHPCYFDFVQYDKHQVGRRWNGFNDLGRVYDFPEPVVKGLIPPGKESNVLGIEACLWTERVQNRDRLGFMLFPRLAAIAEDGWTPAAAKNKARFMERVPAFLRELQRRNIPYFDVGHPEETPEPPGPAKKAGGTANG